MSLIQASPSEPSFVQRSRFLSTELWATNWISPPSSIGHSINLESLAKTVYKCAAGQTETQLLIEGQNLKSLVFAFEKVISKCLSSGDFIQLLSPNRTFQMLVLSFLHLHPINMITL